MIRGYERAIEAQKKIILIEVNIFHLMWLIDLAET
jgi:hypothetical protein